MPGPGCWCAKRGGSSGLIVLVQPPRGLLSKGFALPKFEACLDAYLGPGDACAQVNSHCVRFRPSLPSAKSSTAAPGGRRLPFVGERLSAAGPGPIDSFVGERQRRGDVSKQQPLKFGVLLPNDDQGIDGFSFCGDPVFRDLGEAALGEGARCDGKSWPRGEEAFDCLGDDMQLVDTEEPGQPLLVTVLIESFDADGEHALMDSFEASLARCDSGDGCDCTVVASAASCTPTRGFALLSASMWADSRW